jgi:hypothetical protein
MWASNLISEFKWRTQKLRVFGNKINGENYINVELCSYLSIHPFVCQCICTSTYLTNELIPWLKFLLKMFIRVQVVKYSFPWNRKCYCHTQKIVVRKKVQIFSLSLSSILSSYLGLHVGRPSGFLFLGFLTKTLCGFLFPIFPTCYTKRINLDLIILMILDELLNKLNQLKGQNHSWEA